jgi:H+/Cl- antiporter ClcA
LGEIESIRQSQEGGSMRTIGAFLNHRLGHETLDTRIGQWACYLGAVAIVPTSVVALVRHRGSRADFLLGLGLACLVSLLSAVLGTICRLGEGARDKASLRSRWPEFASYPVCIGLLVIGIRWLAGLGLNPAQVTTGLLMTCALSLAVLVLGMMTTLVRSLRG